MRAYHRQGMKTLTGGMGYMNVIVLRKERESSKAIVHESNEFASRGGRSCFNVGCDDVEHCNLLSFGVVEIAGWHRQHPSRTNCKETRTSICRHSQCGIS